MGIVVSLAMLVALLMLCSSNTFCKPKYQIFTKLGIGFVVLLGAWNAVWFGSQNMTTFWGITSLLSGTFMLLAAQFVYLEVAGSSLIYRSWYFEIKLVVMIILALYFLLYSISIIQMNLGMPFIR